MTKDSIVGRCESCGKNTDYDIRHKLATFIFKHPPEKNKQTKQMKEEKKLEIIENKQEQEKGKKIKKKVMTAEILKIDSPELSIS